MNNYLIPANTKRGQLILGIFRPFDLILFGTGCIITVLLLILVETTSTFGTILILAPAVITGILVAPIPYYHNLLIIIGDLYSYLTTQHSFKWKGWCIEDGKQK